MNHQNYQATIAVPISPEKAIEGISNPARWWATNVTGQTQNTGDAFTVQFGKTFSDFRITEFIPGRKIVWKVERCNLPLFENPEEWKGTSIVWRLSMENNLTLVSMEHNGLTPGLGCYLDCIKGWDFYVKQSLYGLLINGKGQPGTGIFTYIFCSERKYEGLLFFKNDPLSNYSEDWLYIDVKETRGEEIVSFHSAATFYRDRFDCTRLKGDYFMMIPNKALYGNILPLDDILATIYSTTSI